MLARLTELPTDIREPGKPLLLVPGPVQPGSIRSPMPRYVPAGLHQGPTVLSPKARAGIPDPPTPTHASVSPHAKTALQVLLNDSPGHTRNDREGLEKSRLKAREQGRSDFVDSSMGTRLKFTDVIDTPFVTLNQAAGFAPAADRFAPPHPSQPLARIDVEIKREHELKLKKHADHLQQKRRLEERDWHGGIRPQRDMEEQRQEYKWQSIRADEEHAKSRANRNSVGYNLLTQAVNTDSLDGLRQAYSDTVKKYKTDVRAHTFDSRNNSELNPITAQKRLSTKPPSPPALFK